MKKFYAYFLVLIFSCTSHASDFSDSEDDFGNLPDSSSVSQTTLQQSNLKTVVLPALHAFLQKTQKSAVFTSHVIAGACSGAMNVIHPTSEQKQICFACEQRKILERKESRKKAPDYGLVDPMSEFDVIGTQETKDPIIKEMQNKTFIDQLDSAELIENINKYIRQTYKEDACHLDELRIQERIEMLINTAKEQSTLRRSEVAISKQIAQLYITTQLKILERQLDISSSVEQRAEMTKKANIDMALVEKNRAIEVAEKEFEAIRLRQEKIYEQIINREFITGLLIAKNTAHLHERAEQTNPDAAAAHHYESTKAYKKLLEQRRPEDKIRKSDK